MKNLISAALLGISVTACATASAPELTPMELQALQTREFEAEKTTAFAAVMSVFQDLGYTVADADRETGFIQAKSTADSKRDWLFTGANYTTQTNATAFIEPVADGRTKVRLNFVTGTESSTWYGSNSKQDNAIVDAQVYQNAFEKIDQAIFVRQGTL